MADAKSGMGSHRQGQERRRQPRQPGATGRDRDQQAGPKGAREQALRRRGKTRKHTREDR